MVVAVRRTILIVPGLLDILGRHLPGWMIQLVAGLMVVR